MYEIELKYRVDDHDALIERVVAEGGVFVSHHRNDDTYYRHPCRDFVETGEALRIRREDGIPMVTYKGPKWVDSSAEAAAADGSGPHNDTERKGAEKMSGVKAREELEWRLDPGDENGGSMDRLLTQLGFARVTTVSKDRRTYRVGDGDDSVTVTVDDVDSVGKYAEIECVLPGNEPSDAEVAKTRDRVQELADRLGLTKPESRSYLRMLLERVG